MTDSIDLTERVARAISAHTYATTVGHSDCLEWEDMRETDRNTYRRAASAAIAAARPAILEEAAHKVSLCFTGPTAFVGSELAERIRALDPAKDNEQ